MLIAQRGDRAIFRLARDALSFQLDERSVLCFMLIAQRGDRAIFRLARDALSFQLDERSVLCFMLIAQRGDRAIFRLARDAEHFKALLQQSDGLVSLNQHLLVRLRHNLRVQLSLRWSLGGAAHVLLRVVQLGERRFSAPLRREARSVRRVQLRLHGSLFARRKRAWALAHVGQQDVDVLSHCAVHLH